MTKVLTLHIGDCAECPQVDTDPESSRIVGCSEAERPFLSEQTKPPPSWCPLPDA